MKEFTWKENAYDNDDVQYALTYNHPEKFKREDITHIAAEIAGANDELSWWWILKLKVPVEGKRFFLLSGSCDYTGWDCQSGITEHGYFKTPLQAAKAAPTECGGRNIRNGLTLQLKGKVAFGVLVNNGN